MFAQWPGHKQWRQIHGHFGRWTVHWPLTLSSLWQEGCVMGKLTISSQYDGMQKNMALSSALLTGEASSPIPVLLSQTEGVSVPCRCKNSRR